MDLQGVGDRVKARRELHGLNTRDAAAAAGIPTEAWEQLESGEDAGLEEDDLISIADSLGCDLDELVGDAV